MSTTPSEPHVPPASSPPPGGPLGPPAPPMPPAVGETVPNERMWAAGAHLSGFLAAYVALGFLGPLVVLLVQGEKSSYIRKHAVESLNFNLSWLLYIVVGYVLTLVLVGVVVLLALAVAYVIVVILAAVAANEGRFYRYPLTIRFIS